MTPANRPSVTDPASLSDLAISATADDYQPHFIHSDERTWPETNCYLDLCIETVHALGLNPLPMLGATLAADHDGEQWSFVKPDPEDIRALYGLQITEENVWRPVLNTVESGPNRGLLFTVEVDSWWLPDTAGTDYRSGHVKTSIVPVSVDRAAQVMDYIHNAGLYRLSGDDFAGVFNLDTKSEWVLLPYVEQIRRVGTVADASSDLAVHLARKHLDRAPSSNPIDRLGAGVIDALDWLPEAGVATFHSWAFATLRQCGATAEVAADLAAYLDTHGAPGAGAAREPFLAVATTAKSIQFKMARAANGRKVNVDDALGTLSVNWAGAMEILDSSVAS